MNEDVHEAGIDAVNRSMRTVVRQSVKWKVHWTIAIAVREAVDESVHEAVYWVVKSTLDEAVRVETLDLLHSMV